MRGHHKPDQIVGDKDLGVMTRSKLKNDTCLLCEFKSRTVKDALENEDWIRLMNEDIDEIEKKKIWMLVPRPKDKNLIVTKWVLK